MSVSKPPTSPQSARVQRAVWGGLAVVFLIVGIAGVRALIRNSKRPIAMTSSPLEHAAGVLPVLGTVPDFSLTERSGQQITREQLKGGVWVADFIFTRCRSSCPILSARMERLQSQLRDMGDTATRLVSFSVDPESDTPSALTEYADRFHADPQQWLFLTGERTALHRLIADGFHLSIAQHDGAADADPNELITHSDRFVLVDGTFQIRGYYRGTDDNAIENMGRDIAVLR